MESPIHKRLKRKFAGRKGKTEVPISRNRRLDAKRGKKALEVERSGNIKKALLRLKTQRTLKKILRVPQKDLSKAANIAKTMKMKVVVTNLGGTKRRIIKR